MRVDDVHRQQVGSARVASSLTVVAIGDFLATVSAVASHGWSLPGLNPCFKNFLHWRSVLEARAIVYMSLAAR